MDVTLGFEPSIGINTALSGKKVRNGSFEPRFLMSEILLAEVTATKKMVLRVRSLAERGLSGLELIEVR